MLSVDVYFDGSCCPVNPGGQLGYGFHINMNGVEIDCGYGGDPSHRYNSNNVAEYRGLIMALKVVSECENQIIRIYGDSKLVISQMNGLWKIKSGYYRDDALEAKEMVQEIKKRNSMICQWIPREENSRADELSNIYHTENPF